MKPVRTIQVLDRICPVYCHNQKEVILGDDIAYVFGLASDMVYQVLCENSMLSHRRFCYTISGQDAKYFFRTRSITWLMVVRGGDVWWMPRNPVAFTLEGGYEIARIMRFRYLIPSSRYVAFIGSEKEGEEGLHMANMWQTEKQKGPELRIPVVKCVECQICSKLHRVDGDSYLTVHGNAYIGQDLCVVGEERMWQKGQPTEDDSELPDMILLDYSDIPITIVCRRHECLGVLFQIPQEHPNALYDSHAPPKQKGQWE